MKNNRLIIIMGVVAILLIGVASTLFVVRDVGGFNIFNTKDSGCIPYNIFISKGDVEYSVQIDWLTKSECVGFIQYGKELGGLDLIGVDLVHASKSREHTVVLEKLLTKEKYYFLISSQEQSYGSNGSALEFVLDSL